MRIEIEDDTETVLKVLDALGVEYTKEKDLDINKELCETAAYSIRKAFIWERSKEGHDYWSEVHAKLMEYAEGE